MSYYYWQALYGDCHYGITTNPAYRQCERCLHASNCEFRPAQEDSRPSTSDFEDKTEDLP